MELGQAFLPWFLWTDPNSKGPALSWFYLSFEDPSAPAAAFYPALSCRAAVSGKPHGSGQSGAAPTPSPAEEPQEPCAPISRARTKPAAARALGPAAFGCGPPTAEPGAERPGAAPPPPGAGSSRWLGGWEDRKDGEEVGEGFLR